MPRERGGRIPSRDEIRDDTPLLLDVAARVAFPDGSMSGLALRNAANRGELNFARMGGRLYTTLEDIKEMHRLCRGRAKVRAFGSSAGMSEPMDDESPALGRSKTTEASGSALASALHVAESLLKQHTPLSRDTSLRSGRPRARSDAGPTRSRSLT